MFKPAGDKVLVQRADALEKRGTIIVPEVARGKPVKGDVIAVGPGRYIDGGEHHGERQALTLAAGDRVIFSAYGHTEIEVDGVKQLVMPEDDVMGVLKSDGSVQLLLDRVMLEREEAKPLSSVIHIPEAHQEQSQIAKVIAVGPGRRLPDGRVFPCDVKVGDRVLVQRWSQEIEIDERKMLIVGEAEIYGVVNTEE